MQLNPIWSVDIFRGENVESVHHVAVAVVDVHGKQILDIGDASRLVYPRSSIKFLQAIPFVETGAFSAYDLSLKHLALACASHHAEKFHMEMLTEWLIRLKLTQEDLACGPQAPVNKKSAEQWIQQNKPVTKLMNNCSGKHLGMLTTALHMNEKTKDYHLIEHPAQKRIAQVLTEMSGYDFSKTNYGVDGCGVPTYIAPLKSWAVARVSMLNSKNSLDRQRSCQTILNAVVENPELVSGTEGFDYKLQKITKRKLILKSGAEGFCCGLLPDKGLGFALKILDGNSRAIPAIVKEIIIKYANFQSEMINQLEPVLLSDIRNTREEIVGKIRLRKNS